MTPEENKGESASSRHAAVLVTSISLLNPGKGVEDVVDVAGDCQLLGGLGPGIQERLVASAGEG